MRGGGRGEHGCSCRDALLGPALVHVGGPHQAEAGMMVFGVVRGEEAVTVRPGVLDRAETRRERRAVLRDQLYRRRPRRAVPAATLTGRGASSRQARVLRFSEASVG